ncbi:MAG TPA: hypothetical protein VF736_20940 [Pyrinomonadaceae bacterium]|jgi:hypothetical protein
MSDGEAPAAASEPDAPAGAAGRVSRLLRGRALRSALFAFALSRALVFAVLVLAGVTRTAPDPNFPGHYDATVSAHPLPFARILRHEVLTADVNWYVGLAQEGYERRPFDAAVPHNWAFFPLFPLLLAAAALLTGEYVLTGVALSNLFLLAALFLLHRLCALFGLTEEDADRCVFYAAFFPLSYFYSVPMTESLFLLVTLASFYAAKGGRWWAAGLLGALASATRVTGVLLLPALAVLYWQERRGRGLVRKEALAPLLVPAGLVLFMLYLRELTGNALAFKDVLVAWGRRPAFFLTPLIDYLRAPSLVVSLWDVRTLNFASPVAVLACGAALLKRREFALASYALLSAFVALSSGLLQSQTRYAMVVFPVYVVLARAGRRARVDRLIQTAFVALLTLLTAMYAAHYIAALS